MITFKKFINSFEKKYVCLNIIGQSADDLRMYAISNGFDLTTKFDGSKQSANDFDFHVTLFYTETSHFNKNVDVKLNKPITLIPDRLDLLGENKDIPIILLKKTDDLLELREIFKKQGYKDKWNTYLPHISLSYVRKNYDIKNIKLPTFNIVASSISIDSQR